MVSRDQQIAKRRAEVFPLEQFPPEKREEIARLVAQDWPPPKWLRFGLAQMVSRAWYEWHWERGINPHSRRDEIPRWMRAAVLERDGLVCQLCGGDVAPGDVHLDHIKPWSKGGLNSVNNLQVAHSTCNLRKGAKH